MSTGAGASPRVSVIVPCYKQGHYLAGCIDSVLAQGRDEVELIVINDGSPDETDAVARGYGDRIVYVRQENAGLAAARNRGISIARGAYLLFLDSDDELEPGAIDAYLAIVDARPDAAILCGGHRHVDVAGNPLGPDRDAPSFEPDAFHALLDTNSAPPCAFLFRADAVRDADGFGRDPSLYGHEDWDLLLKITGAGGAVVRVPATVARYRVSQASMTSTGATRMFASGIAVLRRHRNRHVDCESCAAIVRKSEARRLKFWIIEHFRRGERGAALKLWAANVGRMIRGGQTAFAAAAPMLAALPTAAVVARWGRR